MVFTPSREYRESHKEVKENMGTIPQFGAGAVINPEESTQIGCVYCLGENVEAPSTFGIVYMWQGTSLCARHVKIVAGGGNAQAANPAV